MAIIFNENTDKLNQNIVHKIIVCRLTYMKEFEILRYFFIYSFLPYLQGCPEDGGMVPHYRGFYFYGDMNFLKDLYFSVPSIPNSIKT